jgi:hypothetical protein
MKQGWKEEADIRVMISHIEPRAPALGIVKSAPTVGQVDVILLYSTMSLRRRAAMEGLTEAILFVNLDIWWNQFRMMLL